MWDIVLKNFNKFFLNFRYSTIFLKEIFFLSLVFGILIILLYHISLPEIFIVILVIFIFDAIILNSIGYKRRKEIEEIKSIVKSIRKNRIISEDDISLSKSLKEIEGNIKGMFRKSQRDLENVVKLAQARSDFLGYVSHELRTPIFTIQGYLETLLNGAIYDPKVNKVFLEKAMRHSDNLNTLLNDLIDISMIESGLMSLSYRYFNLNNFLKDVINEVKQFENSNNIDIIIGEFDKEISVYGDKDKLKQVMINLLSNALKYTNEGNVEVIVLDKNKTVTIKVKDTGIGIPQDELNRIFERFYRTDRERTSIVPGTGLGLAIVKHIIEAHDSIVSVKSEINTGSEFSFKLQKE